MSVFPINANNFLPNPQYILSLLYPPAVSVSRRQDRYHKRGHWFVLWYVIPACLYACNELDTTSGEVATIITVILVTMAVVVLGLIVAVWWKRKSVS